jgi:Sulfotransferase family
LPIAPSSGDKREGQRQDDSFHAVIPAKAGTQPSTNDSFAQALGPGLRRGDESEVISASALLDQARSTTGLTDFGDDWFLAPLEKLVSFINAEAGLLPETGGPVDRIVYALMDRLALQAMLKAKPEILDEEIHVAGAIIGLPRTGSTMLHRLLASAPNLTSPYWWETTFPMPLPDETPGDPTPRQTLAKQTVIDFLAGWPNFEAIDPIDAMEVAEEVILLDKGFLSTTYDSMMHIPSYGFWQADQDHERAYRELKIWLQVIQSQSADHRGKKWILKTPHHLLGGMSGLLSVFPEAKLIMTHRDVALVLPSYCSMCESMTVRASGNYQRETQGAYWSARFASGLKRFAELRETLPADKVIDIHYADTVSDPIGVGKRAMAAMGFEFTAADEAVFAACIAGNAREKRPAHKYAAADFGLDPAQIARDFAFYTEGREK